MNKLEMIFLGLVAFVSLGISSLEIFGRSVDFIEIPTLTLFAIGAIAGYMVFERRNLLKNFDDIERAMTPPLELLGPRENLRDFYDEHFNEATKYVDIMALTSENLMNFYGERLLHKIMSGRCNIRIMILDPDPESPLWELRIKDERDAGGPTIEGVTKQIEEAIDFYQGLQAKIPTGQKSLGSLTVKLHKSIPYFSYFRADDKISLGLYYSFTVGVKAPAISVGPRTDLFKHLEQHFDAIWGRKENKEIISIGFHTRP